MVTRKKKPNVDLHFQVAKIKTRKNATGKYWLLTEYRPHHPPSLDWWHYMLSKPKSGGWVGWGPSLDSLIIVGALCDSGRYSPAAARSLAA